MGQAKPHQIYCAGQIKHWSGLQALPKTSHLLEGLEKLHYTLAGGWPLMYQAMPALGLPSLLRDYLVPFSWASLAWQSYALATWWMELATGVPLDFNCYRVLTAQPSTATFFPRPPQGRSDQRHLLARLPQNTKPR